MSLPLANSPVIVDLNVNVDASGNVSIFSQAVPTVSNVVVVEKELSLAQTLYGSSETNAALFEFQGDGDAINGKRNATFSSGAATAFKNELAACLCAESGTSLEAVNAEVFSGYSATEAYHKMANMGELALAYYAHHLFGHVQATAAIDNDVAIKARFNGTETGAAIPLGLATLITGLDAAAVTAIVKQVLGQDSTRAAMVDNDLSSPDSWQNLKFIPGDKVYVSVTIQRPAILIADDAVQQGDAVATSATRVPLSTKYTMEITLKA
jgi:hypothetical protein